jgi:hypothetical protein
LWRLWQDPEASQVRVDIPRTAASTRICSASSIRFGVGHRAVPDHVEIFVSAVDERLSVSSLLSELSDYYYWYSNNREKDDVLRCPKWLVLDNVYYRAPD